MEVVDGDRGYRGSDFRDEKLLMLCFARVNKHSNQNRAQKATRVLRPNEKKDACTLRPELESPRLTIRESNEVTAVGTRQATGAL